MKRNGVLYSGVMRIEGNDVVYAERSKLLKGKCTVQGFSCGTLMLSSFIKEGHDYVDSSCFSADCGNDTLNILEMIVRGHVIGMSANGIGFVVVADINQNVDVGATYGFVNRTFGFAGSETGKLGIENIGFSLITGIGKGAFVLAFSFGSPFYQVFVYLSADFVASFGRH